MHVQSAEQILFNFLILGKSRFPPKKFYNIDYWRSFQVTYLMSKIVFLTFVSPFCETGLAHFYWYRSLKRSSLKRSPHHNSSKWQKFQLCGHDLTSKRWCVFHLFDLDLNACVNLTWDDLMLDDAFEALRLHWCKTPETKFYVYQGSLWWYFLKWLRIQGNLFFPKIRYLGCEICRITWLGNLKAEIWYQVKYDLFAVFLKK